MTLISELFPTQSRLILEPYKIKGRELVISAIHELIIFKFLFIKNVKIENIEQRIIEPNSSNKNSLEAYHRFIIHCVEKHYKHYKTPTDKNSSLTPERLIRDVYGELNFNYEKFKKGFIIKSLHLKGLLRSVFPYYFIRNIYTKKGLTIKSELKASIEELERYYLMYLEKDPEKLQKLFDKLGKNIILAYNIDTICQKLKIARHSKTYMPHPSFINDPYFYDPMDIDLPDLDLPDFDFNFLEGIVDIISND